MTEHPLKRLFAYAKPYRGRLCLAGVAMLLYAAGTAGLAVIIRPIIDKTLPSKENLALMAWGDHRHLSAQGRRFLRVRRI